MNENELAATQPKVIGVLSYPHNYYREHHKVSVVANDIIIGQAK